MTRPTDLAWWYYAAAAAQAAVVPRKNAADLARVRANFCNLRDAGGQVIFSPFVATASNAEAWLAVQVQAGSTHTVLAPRCRYDALNNLPGYPPAFDWLADPQRCAALVRAVLATRGADGTGITPILMLDDGAPGIRARVDAYWPAIRAAIGGDAADVIVVPGWELVRASSCTSADYSYALEALHAQGWPHIWAHLSVGRASCASNPVEPDDPWQGAESDCWRSHGGQYVEGLLYQADGNTPDADTAPGNIAWLDRWNDVVPRIGLGINGWRVMGVAFFESRLVEVVDGQWFCAVCGKVTRPHNSPVHVHSGILGP